MKYRNRFIVKNSVSFFLNGKKPTDFIINSSVFFIRQHGRQKSGKILFPRTVENTRISREILGNKVQSHASTSYKS